MPPEIEFDWVLSELDPVRLTELAVMDFDWSAQVAAEAGAFIFKTKSRTGLVRLNVRAFSAKYRDEVMAVLADVGRELSPDGLVDSNICYPDGSMWVGWVLFHPEVDPA